VRKKDKKLVCNVDKIEIELIVYISTCMILQILFDKTMQMVDI